jgi:phage terminase large subunit-like protein
VPPPGDWELWILNGGRGAGKTEGGSRFFCRKMRENAGWRGLIIAPTFGDAVEACVEGPSGVLANDPEVRFVTRPGGSKLEWPNGSEALVLGTPTPREVERLRAAGNRHIFWWEEMAANPMLERAWDIAFAGLREGATPIQIGTTTPRPVPFFKRLLAAPGTVTTHGTVFDNPGISDEVKDRLVRHYGQSRIGRQELYGELLDDVPGALWRRDWFNYSEPPRDLRVVVGVDPAITAHETSALTGIVVAGYSHNHAHAWVLADLSCRETPDEWARVVADAFDEYEATEVVAEVNQGGDLVEKLLQTARPGLPVRQVRATRGKLIRAEPVALKYEQRRVDHARAFPELEDQMCSFTHDSEESPDRMDALVWALWALMVDHGDARSVSALPPSQSTVIRKGDLTLVGRKYIDKE